jgi:hypothetical protein
MKNPIVAVAALLLVACGDPDPSTDIPTERIYARFVAETGADGASQVFADFFEKDNDFFTDGEWRYEAVYLAGGDTLDVRKEQRNLLFTGGGTHFEGTLPGDALEQTRFEFDLQRARGDFRDAPGSWGTQPAPMDLWLPEPGAEYSIENDDVVVAWGYGGTTDDMSVRVDARCIAPDVAGDGWRDETFTLGFIGDTGLEAFKLSDHIDPNDCTRYATTLTLVRARAGHLDDAYKPDEDACGDSDSGDCSRRGFVSVRQVRPVEIVLTP